jgi:hypothetical protein
VNHQAPAVARGFFSRLLVQADFFVGNMVPAQTVINGPVS